MKNCILILEPISTGANYVFDVLERGYQPLVLFPKNDYALYERENRAGARERFPDSVIYLEDDGNYETLLSSIRSYPVVQVLIGSEFGAELGDRIASDLGLLGNPPESSALHRDKALMQQRLADRGLPHIRGRFVTSLSEAEAFIREEGLTDAVVKPKSGAASVGVHLCHGREEILSAVKNSFQSQDVFGQRLDGVLVQELLVGTEYIVNTISREGQHYITDIWRYDKIPVEGGKAGNAYNYARLLLHPNASEYELLNYALSVVDALDIRYGPTHGEYMLTADGPKLIEAGARPMGAGLSKPYLDMILGHHITDRVLDAYLCPDAFVKQAAADYAPHMDAMIKVMIMGQETSFDNIPLISLIRSMASVRFSNVGSYIGQNRMKQTVDLETCCGMIYMAHEDSRVLEHDYKVLHDIEMKMAGMLYSRRRAAKEAFDQKELLAYLGAAEEGWTETNVAEKNRDKAQSGTNALNETNQSGKTNKIEKTNEITAPQRLLIFCENANGIPHAVSLSDAFKLNESCCYSRLLLWLKGISCELEEELAAISSLCRGLAPGGMVIVPEESARAFPYGTAGVLAVLEANGIAICVPKWGAGKTIYGKKL